MAKSRKTAKKPKKPVKKTSKKPARGKTIPSKKPARKKPAVKKPVLNLKVERLIGRLTAAERTELRDFLERDRVREEKDAAYMSQKIAEAMKIAKDAKWVPDAPEGLEGFLRANGTISRHYSSLRRLGMNTYHIRKALRESKKEGNFEQRARRIAEELNVNIQEVYTLHLSP